MLNFNGGYYCDIECAKNYGMKNKEKGREIKHKEQKRSYQLSDLKIRKDAAIAACHSFIRELYRGKKCITCDTILTGKFDAGHYLKATHSFTKFMRKNIHGQCVNCNQYNGGREVEYRKALIEKYGLRTVEALERVRHRKVKRSASDYLAIERFYKSLNPSVS